MFSTGTRGEIKLLEEKTDMHTNAKLNGNLKFNNTSRENRNVVCAVQSRKVSIASFSTLGSINDAQLWSLIYKTI